MVRHRSDTTIADYAVKYADQNQLDYETTAAAWTQNIP